MRAVGEATKSYIPSVLSAKTMRGHTMLNKTLMKRNIVANVDLVMKQAARTVVAAD